jgi:hypothetical protein
VGPRSGRQNVTGPLVFNICRCLQRDEREYRARLHATAQLGAFGQLNDILSPRIARITWDQVLILRLI